MHGIRLIVNARFKELEDGYQVLTLRYDSSARRGYLPSVIGNLLANICIGFEADVAIMDPFDAGFKAERDEEADRDGQQMQEEVSEASYAFVRRVNVEHLCLSKVSRRAHRP